MIRRFLLKVPPTTRRFLPTASVHTMTSTAFSSIADTVKFDILSETHALENAKKRKEIARTFICKQYNPTSAPISYWVAYSGHCDRLISSAYLKCYCG